MYLGELAMGMFTVAAGVWGLLSGHHLGMCLYLLLQVDAAPCSPAPVLCCGCGCAGLAMPRRLGLSFEGRRVPLAWRPSHRSRGG